MNKITLLTGDSAELLKQFPDNNFDSVVTDPPYGIEFLGKQWDTHTGTIELWEQVYRVLKPGGHLLAFSAARTYHNLATNIEGVGFEIRDQLMWIYASGFPKAQDVGKNIVKKEQKLSNLTLDPAEWTNLIAIDNDYYTHPNGKTYRKLPLTKGSGAADQYGGNKWKHTFEEQIEVDNEWSGWKTALKPAHEPIVMARKPFKGSCVANVQKHGVGAINIDATRIPYESDDDKQAVTDSTAILGQWSGHTGNLDTYQSKDYVKGEADNKGRFPSNVMGEVEGYQKYFYCPKVNRKERHKGLEKPTTEEHKITGKDGDYYSNNSSINAPENSQKGNNHPTVKPVALMAYLVRLVTPIGGHVLDPFNGSGSTGMACKQEGMDYTGIDLDQHYIDISQKRIDVWAEANNKLDPTLWVEK